MTDKYDPSNREHVAIREGIEVGNGLPVIPHYDVVVDALKTAGFEVVEHFDMHTTMHTDHMEVSANRERASASDDWQVGSVAYRRFRCACSRFLGMPPSLVWSGI